MSVGWSDKNGNLYTIKIDLTFEIMLLYWLLIHALIFIIQLHLYVVNISIFFFVCVKLRTRIFCSIL